MRISEGVPCGRNGYLYNPKMFQDNEEVIIFLREEFRHSHESIMEHMDYIMGKYFWLERDEDWKLLGIWPRILERIYLIDLNMKYMLTEKPVQSYLDAYLYNAVEGLDIEVVESDGKVAGKSHLKIGL